MINKKAFTLIEIVVIAVILGILAVIVLPNALNMIKRAHAQDAMRDLITIYAAQKNYAQNNNGTYASCSDDPAAISCNDALGLNIVYDSSTNYSCGANFCTVTTGPFTMQMDLNKSVPVNNAPVLCLSGSNYLPDNNHNPCCTIPRGEDSPQFCP